MIDLTPIAFVQSTRSDTRDDLWGNQPATIELLPEFPAESLDGIDQFSHVEIIFLFHKVDPADIEQAARHPRDNTQWPRVGIFAQRAKNRPNRLGHSIAQILFRQNRTLTLLGLDAIDGTPILDIKPVMAEFLPRGELRQPPWSRELMKHYWQ